MRLHFIHCIVFNDGKSDVLIVVLCIEAELQALHHRFPYISHVIFQSDNVKNAAVSACRISLIAMRKQL